MGVNATTASATGKKRGANLHSWTVLAAGLVASLVLFGVIRDAVERVARLRFERQASDARRVIEVRMHSYAGVLYGLRALFTNDRPVTRLSFHRFVNSLDLRNRYPSLESVNYMMYVPARDKDRFVESVRHDSSLDLRGYPGFSIKPPGDRQAYYVIVYLEPMEGFDFAFGLDLGANPNAEDPEALAAAVRLTRDSGELIASGLPLRIRSRGREYTAFGMRLAVYRNGMPVETAAQRRAAFVGSVGAGFNVQDLMKGVLDEETARYTRFRLYDAGSSIEPQAAAASAERRLLFDSMQLDGTAPAAREPDDPGAEFTRVLPIGIGGRVWEIQFSASRKSVMGRVDAVGPWVFLGGGIFSSALLFGLLYSLTSSRSRAVAIANEITRDLRASEQALQSSAEQLQAMSRRLVEVQESERREIARELHDRVGQNITALSISLDILKTQMPDQGNAAIRARLEDAGVLLEATANVIENVMSELRPPMLDDYGLLPAVQWYATAFSGRTGLEVSVRGDEGMERLPQASEIALFRIVQEALTNVAKHAHAAHVEIALEHSPAQFCLSVDDDGVGFDAAALSNPARRHGLGMVTMRERTQAVGGRFEIASAAGGGTHVVVRIPH